MELSQGKMDVEEIKHIPIFVVPLKSLQDKGLSVDAQSLDKMKRGIIECHGVYYTIDAILPKAFIKDVYLFYHFICFEEKNITSISVEED